MALRVSAHADALPFADSARLSRGLALVRRAFTGLRVANLVLVGVRKLADPVGKLAGGDRQIAHAFAAGRAFLLGTLSLSTRPKTFGLEVRGTRLVGRCLRRGSCRSRRRGQLRIGEVWVRTLRVLPVVGPGARRCLADSWGARRRRVAWRLSDANTRVPEACLVGRQVPLQCVDVVDELPAFLFGCLRSLLGSAAAQVCERKYRARGEQSESTSEQARHASRKNAFWAGHEATRLERAPDRRAYTESARYFASPCRLNSRRIVLNARSCS